MRLSTVREVDASTPHRLRLPWRRLAGGLVALLVLLGVGLGVRALLSPGSTPDDDPVASSDVTTRLTTQEAFWLLTLRRGSGAADIAERFKDRSVRDVAFILSDTVRGWLRDERLHIIDSVTGLQRQPMPPALWVDGTVMGLFQGREAFLYPDELTLLLWAVVRESDVDASLVWLDPAEPTIYHWPAVALLFSTPEGSLALDPYTGDLQPVTDNTLSGPEILWAAYHLLEARHALLHRDEVRFERALTHVERLAPEFWGGRALRARHALAQSRHAEALELARDLSKATTHPFAWHVEILASTHTDEGVDTAARARRFREVVETHPFEARLAVELGDLLRESRAFRDAWDAYELALSRNPRVVGAHTGLAWLYALSDPDNAQRHARLELTTHINYTPAYLALVFIHATQGNVSAAQQVAAQGRRVAADPQAFDDQVAGVLEQARAVQPTSP